MTNLACGYLDKVIILACLLHINIGIIYKRHMVDELAATRDRLSKHCYPLRAFTFRGLQAGSPGIVYQYAYTQR